jgi:hypothetical protein
MKTIKLTNDEHRILCDYIEVTLYVAFRNKDNYTPDEQERRDTIITEILSILKKIR